LQTFMQQNIQVTLQQENGHGLRAIDQYETSRYFKRCI
jgi:hypothetical protein